MKMKDTIVNFDGLYQCCRKTFKSLNPEAEVKSGDIIKCPDCAGEIKLNHKGIWRLVEE